MKNTFHQNEWIAKRWLMLAGGPESFGGGDEPEQKDTQKPIDQEKRSQLADLSNRVENSQTDANEAEQGAPETNETEEDTAETLNDDVKKTLARNQSQMEKLDPSKASEGELMQEFVKKSPEESAVDQLGNEELSQRWEQDLVALTRSQVQDIEPGALAG